MFFTSLWSPSHAVTHLKRARKSNTSLLWNLGLFASKEIEGNRRKIEGNRRKSKEIEGNSHHCRRDAGASRRLRATTSRLHVSTGTVLPPPYVAPLVPCVRPTDHCQPFILARIIEGNRRKSGKIEGNRRKYTELILQNLKSKSQVGKLIIFYGRDIFVTTLSRRIICATDIKF